MTDEQRDQAYQQGYDARCANLPKTACPYPPDTDYGGYSDYSPGASWCWGWDAAGTSQ